jgi:AcrR family transcriptional regulator/CheY-like chemotaxis protein
MPPDMPRTEGSPLREVLLQAAREILDEPDTAFDLRKVAERAGKSRTAPYLVFGKTEEGGGLEALRLAVAGSGLEELASRIDRARAGATDPETALLRIGAVYLDFALLRPRLFRLMFGAEVARTLGNLGQTSDAGSAEAEAVLLHRTRVQEMLGEVLEACREVGAVGPGDREERALAAWALLHGMALLLLDGQVGDAGTAGSPEHAAALVSRFLLDDAALPLSRAAMALLEAHRAKGTGPSGVPRTGSGPAHPGSDPSHPSSPPPTDSPGFAEVMSELGTGTDSDSGSYIVREELAEVDSYSTGKGLELVRSVIQRSPALRRARRMRSSLEGSRILWIDDRPDLTLPEGEVLEELGADVVRAADTSRAVERLQEGAPGGPNPRFDLIISDIARPGSSKAGTQELPLLRAVAPAVPVIFYVGRVDEGSERPEGSFGITHDPEELLHLVLDILERRRI